MEHAINETKNFLRFKTSSAIILVNPITKLGRYVFDPLLSFEWILLPKQIAEARLCGVSLRTLYHHVHQQSWRRRRSAVPRDPARSERQKRRYRASQALRPPKPRGLKMGDEAAHDVALALVEKARAMSGAALAAAIARQDAESRCRTIAEMTRALQVLAAMDEVKVARARRGARRGGDRGMRRSRRKPWRPMPGS
jgi:hypothetical protein